MLQDGQKGAIIQRDRQTCAVALKVTSASRIAPVGGNGGPGPRLARKIADSLTDNRAKTLVARLMNYFCLNAEPHERFGIMIERIGIERLNADVI